MTTLDDRALDDPAADGPARRFAGPAVSRAVAVRAVGLSAALLIVLAILPQLLRPTAVITLQQVLALVVFASATNLLLGHGGLVSFGQAVFYGVGAYTVALGWLHLHLSFWLLFPAAPVIGALVALPVGMIALRSRRLYFALLTLAFAQLFYQIAQNASGVTLGANGVFGSMVPDALVTNPTNGYLFLLAVTAVSLLLLWKINHSPFGVVLRAVRENRHRCEALGVNAYRHQVLAFVVSGAFCSLAGAMFTVYSQSAYPELLDWTTAGVPVFMAVIGGMFSFLGPAVGAFVYQFGHDYLIRYTSDWQLILGALLLAIVLFRPDGLAGLASVRVLRRAARLGRARKETEAP